MAQYIDKAALVAEIQRMISNYKEIIAKIDKNDSTWDDSVLMINTKIDTLQHLLNLLDTLEVKEMEEITVSDKHIATVTVKEAIERKIINSQFALKGSCSGKMYFYSWKKSISKMPENIANLKLSTNYDFDKGELGSYNIEPRVRFVDSTYGCRPFLDPYVLVWVCDYELLKKGE